MTEKTLAEICSYHMNIGAVDRTSIENVLGAVQAKIQEHDHFIAEYKVSYLDHRITKAYYEYLAWAETKLSQNK